MGETHFIYLERWREAQRASEREEDSKRARPRIDWSARERSRHATAAGRRQGVSLPAPSAAAGAAAPATERAGQSSLYWCCCGWKGQPIIALLVLLRMMLGVVVCFGGRWLVGWSVARLKCFNMGSDSCFAMLFFSPTKKTSNPHDRFVTSKCGECFCSGDVCSRRRLKTRGVVPSVLVIGRMRARGDGA